MNKTGKIILLFVIGFSSLTFNYWRRSHSSEKILSDAKVALFTGHRITAERDPRIKTLAPASTHSNQKDLYFYQNKLVECIDNQKEIFNVCRESKNSSEKSFLLIEKQTNEIKSLKNEIDGQSFIIRQQKDQFTDFSSQIATQMEYSIWKLVVVEFGLFLFFALQISMEESAESKRNLSFQCVLVLLTPLIDIFLHF